MTGKLLTLLPLVTLASVSVLALALGGTETAGSARVPDDPFMCPYCGGAFEPDRFGIELAREAGVRGVLLAIGLR